MAERERIEIFERFAGAKNHPAVAVGIGDDAALLRTPGSLVVSVDTLIEGQHFDRSFAVPEYLGDKLLSVSVSDLAAKGALPQWCLVSVGTASGENEFLQAVYRGLSARAEELGVAIAGGNVTRAEGPQWFDLFLAGHLQGEFKPRSGARVGDAVGVIGNLGDSAAGLQILRRWGLKAAQAKHPELVLAHLRPRPPLAAGIALSRIAGVHATIDISDGLASEFHHLASASKVGFEIQERDLPRSASCVAAAEELGMDPSQWQWSGGEDYTVLFTYDPASEVEIRNAGVGFTTIGRVVSDAALIRIDSDGKREPLAVGGWDPFGVA